MSVFLITDFKGFRIGIPNLNQPTEQEEIQINIDEFEPAYLEYFGYSFAQLMIAEYQDIVPTQRSIDFFEGVQAGQNSCLGDIRLKGNKEAIGCFIGANYIAENEQYASGVGTSQPASENALKTDPTLLISEYWNRAHKIYCDWIVYLNENQDVYPEFDYSSLSKKLYGRSSYFF